MKNNNIPEIVKVVYPEYDPADGHTMNFMDNHRLWMETIHKFTDLAIQLYLNRNVDPGEEMMACKIAESLGEYSGVDGKTSGDILYFFIVAQVYIRHLFIEYAKQCEVEEKRRIDKKV